MAGAASVLFDEGEEPSFVFVGCAALAEPGWLPFDEFEAADELWSASEVEAEAEPTHVRWVRTVHQTTAQCEESDAETAVADEV